MVNANGSSSFDLVLIDELRFPFAKDRSLDGRLRKLSKVLQ